MNIQELETKYKELGAEIERLKQQPEGVWKPKAGLPFWTNNSQGGIIFKTCWEEENNDNANYNTYKTRQLAERASLLQRRSNLVIQACLNFDPDFVLDWDDQDQLKYGLYYSYYEKMWAHTIARLHDVAGAYVSSSAIADKVLAYLNTQESR